MFPQVPADHLYHIILLRHGQSTGNAMGYYQGQSDFPLDETGKAQARALAERWKTEQTSFQTIIASPLARARETAEIIAAALAVPVELDATWMERNNGMLAGLRPEEAEERYPRPATLHPFVSIGQTGESQWELYMRAGRAVQDLLRRPPAHYLIVSHGGLLNMVMYVMLGILPQTNLYGARFRFRNAAFATLTYDPNNHTWALEGINDRSHWVS